MVKSPLIRSIAVVIAAVLLLPSILFLYCGMRPDSPAEEIGAALIDAVPLGEELMNTVSLIGNDKEALLSSLDWLLDNEFSKSARLVMEISQIFLISVIMLALDTLIGQKLKKGKNGPINQLPNVLFTILAAFLAGLFTKWIYIFFIEQVSELTGASQQVWLYVVSALSVIGSIVALIFGGGFIKTSIKCALNVIKALLSFILTISLLLGIFPWYITIIALIVLLWGACLIEKLID